MTKYNPGISHRNSDGTQGLVCQAQASYASFLNQVLNMGMTNSKCIREVQKTLRGTMRIIIQKCFIFIHWLTIADIKHHDYDNLFNKEFT